MKVAAARELHAFATRTEVFWVETFVESESNSDTNARVTS
jgi:hypothetical protein